MPNFHLENSKNKRRANILLSPYFFVLAVILTVTFGLLLLSNFQTDKSDISVLIIPKSESASFQIDQIMENLTDITHRLSFYDRVLSDNPEIKDPFSGLSKDQRKEAWNKSFEIERLSGSTTLNISVFNADKAEASKIARQMALSLSEVAGRFYNIQTELEFRIIEGPINSSFVRFWQWLIAFSILSGLAFSFFILFLFNIFSKKVQRKITKNIIRRDYFAPPVDGIKELSELIENDLSVSAERKAAAPSNLPIAEEETSNIDYQAPVTQQPVDYTENLIAQEEEKKGEPTDEEYRERLNKLLRGEI